MKPSNAIGLGISILGLGAAGLFNNPCVIIIGLGLGVLVYGMLEYLNHNKS